MTRAFNAGLRDDVKRRAMIRGLRTAEHDQGSYGGVHSLQDRADGRYWRTDFAVRGKPIESFRERLPALLEEGLERLEMWGANPDQLQFATKLDPMPSL